MKKKTPKKLLAVLTAGALAVSMLAGCGSSSSSSDSTDSSSSEESVVETTTEDGTKVIKVGISGAVDTLNPFAVFTTGTWSTLSAYYERLFNYTEDNSDFSPQLCESYEQIDDYTYELTIYDYITDWNGNNITADDIVFCYTSAIEGGATTGLDTLESVEKVDNYTIRFTFNDTIVFGAKIAFAAVDIVSQAEYEASEDGMATSCVGTGHYIVSEFVPSSSMTLVKNENYWQTEELTHYRSMAEADEIQIMTIAEDSQLAVALETGTIDVAKLNTGYERFEGDDDYVQFTTSSTSYYYIRFNVGEDSVFYNNVALRQAINYAINVDDIITGTYSGNAVKMNALGLPNQNGYQSDWDDEGWYEYDLEKAQELMAEAGYPDGGLTVRLVILNNDTCKSWSTIVQAQLSQIGITVEVESLDSAVWYSACNSGDFDMCAYNVNRPHIADNYAASIGCSQYYTDTETTPYLAEILENEEWQALVDEAIDETTTSDEAVDALHQYAKEQAYVALLAYPISQIYARAEANIDTLGYSQNFLLVPNCFTYKD